MLFAAALLLILGALIRDVLIPGARAVSRTQHKSEAQQSALVVINRIRQCVGSGSPSGETVTSQLLGTTLPDGAPAYADTILFTSCLGADGAITVDSNGDIVYDTLYAFYLDENGLVRYAIVDLSTSSITRSTWAPSPNDSVLARNITSFYAAVGADGLLLLRVDAQYGKQSAMLVGSAPTIVALTSPSPTPGP